MYQHVTVVPTDKIIIVEGMALRFNFAAPDGLHAIQWHEGSGHMEVVGQGNAVLSENDYVEKIAPFVALWEAERARLEAEAEAAEAARLAEYNSERAKAERIREERDRRIAETDYLLAADYPISAEKLELVKAYRQALRDIPQQEGFPWSGEIDDPAIPWPVLDEAATQAEH